MGIRRDGGAGIIGGRMGGKYRTDGGVGNQ